MNIGQIFKYQITSPHGELPVMDILHSGWGFCTTQTSFSVKNGKDACNIGKKAVLWRILMPDLMEMKLFF